MNTTPIDHKIEFMAWDKKAFCILEVVTIDFDQESISIRDEEAFYYESLKNIELMQLTAIRSTNNEPIYNHMIVKNEFGSLYCIDMFNYELMHVLSWSKELEIVGNRFQHNELLELCK